MTGLRRKLLIAGVLAVAAIPGWGREAPATVPDFSGMWAHPSLPGMEPLASGPTSLVNLQRRNGRSNVLQLVGDYHNPILKPEAAAIVKKRGEESLAHYGFHNPRNQCWPNGVPFVLPTAGMQMFQQSDHITFQYLVDHQVRHVRLNAQHPAKITPSWYGDSVAHYEGDTLVIDTVGIKAGPFAMVDMYGTPFSPALHVVERYRLIDYADAKAAIERSSKENIRFRPGIQSLEFDPDYRGKHLQLQFTVEDEGVFTRPWTATITYSIPLGRWEEHVCAESRRGYFSNGAEAAVPVASKPDF